MIGIQTTLRVPRRRRTDRPGPDFGGRLKGASRHRMAGAIVVETKVPGIGGDQSRCSRRAPLTPHQPSTRLTPGFRFAALMNVATEYWAFRMPADPPRPT